jgi:hypothetical protein
MPLMAQSLESGPIRPGSAAGEATVRLDQGAGGWSTEPDPPTTTQPRAVIP